jgi:hypothetical protein
LPLLLFLLGGGLLRVTAGLMVTGAVNEQPEAENAHDEGA